MPARWQLARLLDRMGAIEALLRLRARAPSPWLTILTYHRVREPSHYLFDDGVVDATPEDFDHQMATIARYCNPVGIDELCAFAAGARLPPNPVAVTFDDGYRDNHEIALPIMRRHGVRGIFFIATSYLTERRVFWWDRVAFLVKSSPRAHLALRYPAEFEVDLPPGIDRRSAAYHAVLRLVKDHYALDLERFLTELAVACGVEWTAERDRAFADELLLTWDEVRELRRAGMDVESHTRTHRVLQTLPPAELDDELVGSRADLKRELGVTPRAVSYPVGYAINEAPRIRAAVARAGYELGFTNATRYNTLWGRFERFDIRRLSFDYQVPQSFFRGVIALPCLAP